jgi:nicotinamide-nucleotide amidase
MTLDESWRAHIAAIVERMGRNRGWSAPGAAIAAGVAKQATVPVGAHVIAPTGTAPGFVVPPATGEGPPIVVLPGPPRELQAMWPQVLATPAVNSVLARAGELRQSTLRLANTLEAELAATLREQAAVATDLEITTCLRDAEVEIVTRYRAEQQEAYDRFAAMIGEAYGRRLFSADGRTVDDIVADALLSRGLTVATCESCTGGKVAGRLTDRPGSSAYVLGGLVTYSNEAKTALAGVPAKLITEHGAVSARVALAMAQGVRESLGADVGISTTGVAGPGGGTPEKPVGLVHLCVVGPAGMLERRVRLPGARADVRERTVSIAMHMLRELLS